MQGPLSHTTAPGLIVATGEGCCYGNLHMHSNMDAASSVPVYSLSRSLLQWIELCVCVCRHVPVHTLCITECY